MRKIDSITVYCSSSSRIPKVYLDAGAALGAAIARQGWTLVYGGNCVGCMDALAKGARQAGGKVVGITPRLMVDKGISDQECDELLVTTNMRQRKGLMEERGDAFVTLPGGLGTLEEIFEIIVGKQLGFHDKPIVILNIAGFYDPFIAMIEHGVANHFIKPAARQLYYIAETVEDAIDHIRTYRPPAVSEAAPGMEAPSGME